jgi:hypothetical protein
MLVRVRPWSFVVDAGASFVAAAIKVTDGTVEVVSERHWKRFTANESR